MASVMMMEQDDHDKGSAMLLSAEDIVKVRGRFEQLEYEMTSTTTTSHNYASSCCWKDFRRVYAELDILQEEIQRSSLVETEASAILKHGNDNDDDDTVRVGTKDLECLLEKSHPRLGQLWRDTLLSLERGHEEEVDVGEDTQAVVRTQPPQQEEATIRDSVVPRAIDQQQQQHGRTIVSSWVDFMPSRTNERAIVQERHEVRNIVPYQNYGIGNNPVAPINLVIRTEDLSGHTSSETMSEEEKDDQRRRIRVLLDQCEATKFPFKKRLCLSRMGISSTDLPMNDLLRAPLGNALHKLSLAANPLRTIPIQIVQYLPSLRHLDLSECELHELPREWNLPLLKKLNLSHNRLRDFPHEDVWKGLPELVELNLYGNKIAAITMPTDSSLLRKLEVLNVGYNDLAYLPQDLDQLVSLKYLKVMNNFLELVPSRVCEMNLKMIDVTFNPVIQPPLETCERGIASMRRYFYALQMEEAAMHQTTDRYYGLLRRSI